MHLVIKNMVCDRCKMAVSAILSQHNINPKIITLGYVELYEELNLEQMQAIETSLKAIGFEIIRERKEQVVNNVKGIIITLLSGNGNLQEVQLSKLISNNLKQDYKSISTLFSQVEGITIEKYYIKQRIEKVKELISYNILSLSEIAFLLGFSSVAHLSAQFKQVVGVTPSSYKVTLGLREGLDKI